MSIPEEFAVGLMVGAGAIVHAVTQWQNARLSQSEFGVVDFLILTVIAGFSGVISGLLATLFYDSFTLILLSAGIGAFLGITGMNMIANLVLEVLTSRLHEKKD